MAETPRRVGARPAPHAVGFQVSAATLGVAVLPSVAGLVSERFGLEAIGRVIACCALVLFGPAREACRHRRPAGLSFRARSGTSGSSIPLMSDATDGMPALSNEEGGGHGTDGARSAH